MAAISLGKPSEHECRAIYLISVGDTLCSEHRFRCANVVCDPGISTFYSFEPRRSLPPHHQPQIQYLCANTTIATLSIYSLEIASPCRFHFPHRLDAHCERGVKRLQTWLAHCR